MAGGRGLAWSACGQDDAEVDTAEQPEAASLDQDEAQLLIAALNHAWAWYDVRITRGLHVVNYFLVAMAILATAYVSAINAKLYGVAALLGLSGIGLALVSFTVGLRQKEVASVGEAALTDLQDRIADKVGIDSFRMFRAIRPRGARRYAASFVAFGMAVLLSLGSVVYALVR